MDKARFSQSHGNVLTRLISAARSCRQQLVLVAAAAALGLAIVLNIAMASETTTEKAQMAYLKKNSSEKSMSIH